MQKPSWKLRRRAVFSSLIFCMVIISYIVFFETEQAVDETVIFSAFGLMGAIIASYIGGAVYEDTRLHPRKKEQDETQEEEG